MRPVRAANGPLYGPKATHAAPKAPESDERAPGAESEERGAVGSARTTGRWCRYNFGLLFPDRYRTDP